MLIGPSNFGLRTIPLFMQATIVGLVVGLFLLLRRLLKFNPKIAAGLAISMGALVFSGYFSYMTLIRSQESLAWISQTAAVLSVSAGVSADLNQAEAHSRGYLWTMDPTEMDAWQKGVAKAARGIKELRSMTGDNAHQQLALDRIEPLFTTTVAKIQARLDLEQGQGRHVAMQSFGQVQGWNTIQPLNQLLWNFADEERDLLRERMYLSASSLSQTRLVVGLGRSLTLLFLGAAGVFAASELKARKLVNDRLRQSEELFRLLVSGVKDYAILMLDQEGHVASWNEGAEKIKGYRADEIIGQHFSRFYTAEDLAEGKPAHELEIAQTAGRYEEEGWRIRKDGSRYWADVVITPLHDEQGRLRGFGKVARDITDRKQADDEIRRLNAQLEGRSVELLETNQELEAFTYTAAHDLRAPLRHMNGFVGFLRDDWYDKLDDEGRRCLNKIATASRDMGMLLDDLLNFSRLGRTELQRTRVSLDRLVEDVKQELEPECRGRALDWAIGALPVVDGDVSLLHQVVFNLMANAVKYTSKGASAQIEIGSSDVDDNQVQVWVRDNGAGFEMQYVDKLFRVFQRLHKTQDFEGTGIGLAIVRRIVERHGGRVWAEGALGKGATFYFSMPREGLTHG